MQILIPFISLERLNIALYSTILYYHKFSFNSIHLKSIYNFTIYVLFLLYFILATQSFNKNYNCIYISLFYTLVIIIITKKRKRKIKIH